MVKVFEHYLEFPEEVRMMVINEMEPEDRCRFTRCSKLSQIEAQESKNYMYGMKFKVYSEKSMIFDAVYIKKNKNSLFGDYTVIFARRADGKKYISYSKRYEGELWRSELSYSTDLLQFACELVKCMLNIYQHTIKMLDLQGTGDYDFGIRSLNNLETLTLGDNTDIPQIMSKIRKPLKEFECSRPIPTRILEDFEKIYKIQDLFKVHRIDITYEQFQKLSAQKMYLEIGNLTEEDIHDFIKSWQNDKLRKSFEYCRWWISFSTFDVRKLLRLLGIHQNNVERQEWVTCKIRHKKDAGKKAQLSFGRYSLDFYVLN